MLLKTRKNHKNEISYLQHIEVVHKWSSVHKMTRNVNKKSGGNLYTSSGSNESRDSALAPSEDVA